MNDKEIITTESNGSTKPTLNIEEMNFSGFWHTVKTFCSFLAFISLLMWFFPQTFQSDLTIILIMGIIGIVCAVVSCIAEVLKITNFVATKITGVLTAISIFTFIPFVPLIVAIVSYVSIFAAAIGLVCMFPYVVTVIIYIVKLIKAKIQGTFAENKKKEIITICAGLLTAVAIFVICLIVRTTMVTVTKLSMDDLNTQQVYSEYISENPDRAVEGVDIANPTSSEYDANTLSQTDVYEFETTVNGVTYGNTVTIDYEYRDGEWSLRTINHQKDLENATIDISGIFEGLGKFEGTIAMRDFKYTFKIDKLTKDGGTASLVIYDDRLNENLADEKCNITVTDIISEENDMILDLDITFNQELSGGIKNVTGKYSVASGELSIYGFSFNDDIILSAK